MLVAWSVLNTAVADRDCFQPSLLAFDGKVTVGTIRLLHASSSVARRFRQPYCCPLVVSTRAHIPLPRGESALTIRLAHH